MAWVTTHIDSNTSTHWLTRNQLILHTCTNNDHLQAECAVNGLTIGNYSSSCRHAFPALSNRRTPFHCPTFRLFKRRVRATTEFIDVYLQQVIAELHRCILASILHSCCILHTYTMRLLAAVLGSLSLVNALDNGLGRVPPLGWNSWNHFGCDINEELIKGTADVV